MYYQFNKVAFWPGMYQYLRTKDGISLFSSAGLAKPFEIVAIDLFFEISWSGSVVARSRKRVRKFYHGGNFVQLRVLSRSSQKVIALEKTIWIGVSLTSALHSCNASISCTGRKSSSRTSASSGMDPTSMTVVAGFAKEYDSIILTVKRVVGFEGKLIIPPAGFEKMMDRLKTEN
ncbi:hypothetical protein OSTOST_05401 [Ostertagia ostertagi]